MSRRTPNSPSLPGAMTSSTSGSGAIFPASRLLTESYRPSSRLLLIPFERNRSVLSCAFNEGLLRPRVARSKEDALRHLSLDLDAHLFCLRDRFFDWADHVEGLFGQMIVLALEDLP